MRQLRTWGDLPLDLGSDDPAVGDIQRQLVSVGYYLVATGTYDTETAEVVRSFQLSKGLNPTGAVDLETLDAIARAANEVAQTKRFKGGGLHDELSMTGRVPVGGVLAALGLGWLLLTLLKKKPKEATT